jgi:DivIVA domain-containing protein
MIDLTPLDVRNKRGDFKKLMRGYDPHEVDVFLEIIAERLEALTRENMALKERSGALQTQVTHQTEREQAVQAALVTAQELRADIRNQAQREAENIIKSAETEARRMMAEAEAEARTKLRGSERRMDKLTDEIQEFERRRTRFLRDFRQLLERELDVVIVEEGRTPLEERTIDLELGARRPAAPPAPRSDAEVELPPPADVPVDQLAAAYERSADAEQVSQREAAPSADGTSPHPSQTGQRRQDNLLLYLDTDEPAGG